MRKEADGRLLCHVKHAGPTGTVCQLGPSLIFLSCLHLPPLATRRWIQSESSFVIFHIFQQTRRPVARRRRRAPVRQTLPTIQFQRRWRRHAPVDHSQHLAEWRAISHHRMRMAAFFLFPPFYPTRKMSANLIRLALKAISFWFSVDANDIIVDGLV